MTQQRYGVLTDDQGLNARFKRTNSGLELVDGMPEGVSYQRIFDAAHAANIEVHWANGARFTERMPVKTYESHA